MKEAIEKGAVDYILKYQIETKDLVEKVKNLLTDLQGSGPGPAQTPSTTVDPTIPPVQNPQQPTTTQTNPPADPTQNNNSG